MHSLAQVGVPVGGAGFAVMIAWAIYAIWFILLLASLAGVVRGLVNLRRRRGKIVATISVVVATSLILLAYIFAVPPYYSVVLDLAASRTPPPGTWQEAVGHEEMLCFQGRVDADIRFPNGHVFKGRADLIELDRQDRQIVSVTIDLPALSLDQAGALTRKFIADWGLNPNRFDQWYQDRKAHKADPYGGDRVFSAGQNKADPQLGLSLRNVGLDDDSEWVLMLDASWQTPETTRPVQK